MDEALAAYDAGRADGLAGLRDVARVTDATTGRDYAVGVADGRLEAFENDLVAAIRRALDAKKGEAS